MLLPTKIEEYTQETSVIYLCIFFEQAIKSPKQIDISRWKWLDARDIVQALFRM